VLKYVTNIEIVNKIKYKISNVDILLTTFRVGFKQSSFQVASHNRPLSFVLNGLYHNML